MSECPQCKWDPDRLPTKQWEITLEIPLLSQTALGSNDRAGFKYRNWKRKCARELSKFLAHTPVPRAHVFREGRITREFGFKKRRFDWENVVGGCKPLLDVLQEFGLLVNDNEKFWRGYYAQEKSADGVDRIKISLAEF